MSFSINKHSIGGHVGKDPEFKVTPGGTAIAKFSIATNHRQKDDSGTYQDNVEWHNIVTFGRTAEIVRDYIKKGDPIYIEGRSQTRSWEDKTSGKKQYMTEVIVNDLQLLGTKGGNRTASADKGPITDEDIPF
jgi:single-strand DNA-binding protein